MWNVRLGTVNIVKTRIDIDTPDAKLIRIAPYRARTIEREIDKEDIDKIKEMGVF